LKNYKILSVRTKYWEMTKPPIQPSDLEKEGCVIMKLNDPNIHYYRYLYKKVGEDVNWVNRLIMEDEELYNIINSPNTEIFVLYYKGSPAGFAEIDRKTSDQVKLVYFGIIPRYREMGFGSYLLNWTIDKVWTYKPERFWFHTCELDHDAAVPTFQKAGFEIFEENLEDQLILG